MRVLHCLSVSTILPHFCPSNICIGLTVALRLKVTHFHTFFTLLFSIFLRITRHYFDPQIANANRGGSNLFIYLSIYFFSLLT